MRKHWSYLKYVARHKWFVFVAGRRRGVPLAQLIVHDWSKFLPDEWAPYAEWFYGRAGGSWHAALKSTDPYEQIAAIHRKDAFQRAFLRHLHRSPHHHQYWVLPGYGDKPSVAYPIPDRYLLEMLADWDGAGRAISGVVDTPGWYAKNKDAMVLYRGTRATVEQALGMAT